MLCIAVSFLSPKLALARSRSAPTPSKPNVVFFLVDNTGWGDWGVYGGQVATPNIDRLAQQTSGKEID